MESKDTSSKQPARLINFSYLDELSEDDVEFKISMINQFINNAPEIISEMRSLCESKDWESLRRLAHKFKPQLGFMGILSVYNEVEKIEHNSDKKANLEQIPDSIDSINDVCNKAILELREEAEKLSGKDKQ